MTKYTIEYEKEGCIGSGSCVGICPANWKMDDENKADVIKTDIEEEELQCNKEAAEACPVNVIHIKENETGERLI